MGEKTVIYYYTGTGNSLLAAMQVAEKLGSTDLISIYNLRDDINVPEKYDRVGICTPTCFAEPPRIVKEICREMQLLRRQKVFIISTYGGAGGPVCYDLKNILQPGTDHPIQTFDVRMPSNHIVGMDPFPDDVVKEILESAKETTKKIAEAIENDAPPEELEEPDREAIIKLSADFNSKLGVDRESREAGFYTTESCNKCGICERLCRCGNIILTEDGVEWGHDCEQCMACIQWCPKGAIRHPNVPEKRRHYHNPDITLEDMLKSEFLSDEK